MLASPHLAAVTALCTTPDGLLWSASSDRLCSWPVALDCTAPVKQVELTLASVVCLLPLGQFVWLGGADGRTKKPIIKVGASIFGTVFFLCCSVTQLAACTGLARDGDDLREGNRDAAYRAVVRDGGGELALSVERVARLKHLYLGVEPTASSAT